MGIKELLKKPLPEMPYEIADALSKNGITLTPFERKNDILSDISLQNEIGFKKMPDGTYLVSMACPMPEITVEMVEWWFWWHPQAKERYQVWFLSEYIEIFVNFYLYYMKNINEFSAFLKKVNIYGIL